MYYIYIYIYSGIFTHLSLYYAQNKEIEEKNEVKARIERGSLELKFPANLRISFVPWRPYLLFYFSPLDGARLSGPDIKSGPTLIGYPT